MTKFRTAYGPHLRVPHPKCGKSLTEQHHRKACDINSIMARYTKTGLIDHINKHQGRYGDVSGADFKAAQDLIAETKTEFYELPAAIRDEFNQDVAAYLDLMMTDEGVEILENMLNPSEPEIVPETASHEAEETVTDEETAVT